MGKKALLLCCFIHKMKKANLFSGVSQNFSYASLAKMVSLGYFTVREAGKAIIWCFFRLCRGRQALPEGKMGKEGSWEATNRGRASLCPPTEDKHSESAPGS